MTPVACGASPRVFGPRRNRGARPGLDNARAAKALKEDGFSTDTRVAATAAAVRSAEASVSAARAGLDGVDCTVATDLQAVEIQPAGSQVTVNIHAIPGRAVGPG